jgi:hypothetical protein
VVYELMLEMKNTLMDLINSYIDLPVKSIEYRKGPTGLYIVVTVDSDAKSSLERWLRVADKLRDLGLIVVEWSGETNVTPAELGIYLGMIFAKMSVYLSMSSSFDAVKSLREEWSE